MPLLQTVRNELPEVMVYLQESSGTALNDKLLAGQLDMAVLYERSPVAGIVSQPLLKRPLRSAPATARGRAWISRRWRR